MFLVSCSAFLWRFVAWNCIHFLYSFFLHHINIWNQKVLISVFYEEFLPITWIKPRPGVRNMCRAWHHDASNISDGPPVLGCTLHYCLWISMIFVTNWKNSIHESSSADEQNRCCNETNTHNRRQSDGQHLPPKIFYRKKYNNKFSVLVLI